MAKKEKTRNQKTLVVEGKDVELEKARIKINKFLEGGVAKY